MQDVHRAIAEGLAEELTHIPGHQWTAYRRYGLNGDYEPPGNWNVELITQPPSPKHPASIIIRLTIQEEAITTNPTKIMLEQHPKTIYRTLHFDYHDPQLVENIDQYAQNVLALIGKPH